MYDIVYPILTTIIAAVATAVAAWVVQYIARRQKELAKESKEEIADIADIVRTQEAKQKAASLGAILEKIPSGLQIDEFTKKLEDIASQISKAVPPQPGGIDAVENLINGYHEQALEQAKVQFWFSIVAATVGFALIIYQGINADLQNLITLLKTLPGVVMDTVAFLFFKQAAETRQRATELYDRLRTDKRNTESINLVASIEDVRVRSAVKAQIALHMGGLNPSPIDLTNFLSFSPGKTVDQEPPLS